MKKLCVIILSILCLTFATVPVFADEPEDLVYTYTSSWQSTYLCGGSSSYSCSDYKYLVINSDFSITGSNRQVAFYFASTNNDVTYSQQANIPYNISPEIKIKISDDISGIQSWLVNNLSSSESFTVTLTSSDNCPTCPVCPEPQDPNRSPIMDDFHNVFMNTMLSIIPITAIIFVVWFFIDMLSSLVFGRGK